MPPQPVIRYQIEKAGSKLAAWRFNQKIRTIPPRRNLRIEVLAPATVHWSADGWKTATDSKTVDTGLGIHYVDLETATLSPGDNVAFTFFWPEANRWEGADFQVTVSERTILGSGKGSSRVRRGDLSTSIMSNREPILVIRWRRAILSLCTGKFPHALRRSSGT